MLDLLDYRRTVFNMYHDIREQGTSSSQAFQHFRFIRDQLFKHHTQSPLNEDQKRRFNGLRYYDYDPAYYVIADIEAIPNPTTFNMDLGNDGAFTMTHFANVSFSLPTGSGTLGLYWINGYGGGVFLPFRDATNNETTYGGGRYLFDTIKGADLGTTSTQIVLDFNYAYHPSCHYNSRWVCPLAPPQNQLSFPIFAGEQAYEGAKNGDIR